MKTVGIIAIVFISLFATEDLMAQRGHRADRRVVVVRHSRFRPRHVVVFRPHWHARAAFHRRWVYFPRYNFYWDNWRNHYYYFNGTAWISKSKAPAVVDNVDLSNEKYYELNEDDDDIDDIALANSKHQEKYKAN